MYLQNDLQPLSSLPTLLRVLNKQLHPQADDALILNMMTLYKKIAQQKIDITNKINKTTLVTTSDCFTKYHKELPKN